MEFPTAQALLRQFEAESVAQAGMDEAITSRPYRVVYPLRVIKGEERRAAGPFAPYDEWFEAEVEWPDDDELIHECDLVVARDAA